EARRRRSERQAVSLAREFRAKPQRRKERSSVFASSRLRARSPAAPLLMLVASCASAPSQEPEPEPERESGAESPAQAITPQAAPEPEPEPAGTRGPWTEERTLESAPYDEPGAPSVIVHA